MVGLIVVVRSWDILTQTVKAHINTENYTVASLFLRPFECVKTLKLDHFDCSLRCHEYCSLLVRTRVSLIIYLLVGQRLRKQWQKTVIRCAGEDGGGVGVCKQFAGGEMILVRGYAIVRGEGRGDGDGRLQGVVMGVRKCG